jgi:hypothetical protein
MHKGRRRGGRGRGRTCLDGGDHGGEHHEHRVEEERARVRAHEVRVAPDVEVEHAEQQAGDHVREHPEHSQVLQSKRALATCLPASASDSG